MLLISANETPDNFNGEWAGIKIMDFDRENLKRARSLISIKIGNYFKISGSKEYG